MLLEVPVPGARLLVISSTAQMEFRTVPRWKKFKFESFLETLEGSSRPMAFF